MGPYIGTCALVAGFGIADAHVQGGLYGDLSYMNPEFIQVRVRSSLRFSNAVRT